MGKMKWHLLGWWKERAISLGYLKDPESEGKIVFLCRISAVERDKADQETEILDTYVLNISYIAGHILGAGEIAEQNRQKSLP